MFDLGNLHIPLLTEEREYIRRTRLAMQSLEPI